MRLVARKFDDNSAIAIVSSAGCVEQVAPATTDDARLPWIAPGLVDIQVNGYGGQEFSSLDLTAERVGRVVQAMWSMGVTQFLPTLTTQSFETLSHGLRAIAAACDHRLWGRTIAGIHVEGPYISVEDGPRGAHPAQHCHAPDYDEFCRLQEAAGGRIRLLTMAPEYEQAPRFIEQVTADGVVVSIGHTAANGQQIADAVAAGARLSTHLGNGAHRQLRRHPNYIWHQLADDRLSASLIVDGHHLPPEVVQTMIRAKGLGRCILVSDLSGLAGLPAGRYTSSGCELEILPDGRLVIAGQDQLLAGASAPIGTGIANAMRFAALDLPQAIALATRHPAELLSLRLGGFAKGDPADFVLFDVERDERSGLPSGIQVRQTVLDGETVYAQT